LGLGNIAFAHGDTTAAITHYQTAIDLASDDAAAHNNLGAVYAAQGLLA